MDTDEPTDGGADLTPPEPADGPGGTSPGGQRAPAPAPGTAPGGDDGDEGDGPSAGRWRSGWGGCALWALATVLVIVAGCSIGLVLRPSGDKATTVAQGDGWRARVQRQGDEPCVEVFAGDVLQAGQCSYTVSNADGSDGVGYVATSITIGGETLVFGPVPDGVAKVRLRLADGTRPVVPVAEASGVRYFLRAGTSEDKGPTELLAADGTQVTLPS